MTSGKPTKLQRILIRWLSRAGMYSVEDATKDILEAQITMKDNLVTIKYSNGVEDFVLVYYKTNQIG